MKNAYASTAVRALCAFVACTVLTILVYAVSPQFAHAQVLTRQLEFGMTGTDVSALQTFLATDPSIYPQGLVTGYFGTLTRTAVANFQSRNGLPAVGRVGPLTLAVLNTQITGGTLGGSLQAPAISSVGITSTRDSATVNWGTNELARGVLYYSSSPLVTFERTNSVDVSGNTAQTDTAPRVAQSVRVSGLQPNTTYYYLVYATDQDGLVSVTWPNTFRTAN